MMRSSLKVIRSLTGSQWSLNKIEVMWSDLEAILLPHSELVVTCLAHRMVNHIRLSWKSPVLR